MIFINNSSVTSDEDKLSNVEASTFFGLIEPVLLQPSDMAYRFCMNKNYPFSNYWFDRICYDFLFSVYRSELQQFTFKGNESARQRFTRILQNLAAVLHHFPDSSRDYFIVNFIVKIKFEADVVGYLGATKTQQTFHNPNTYDIKKHNSNNSQFKLKESDKVLLERKQGGLQQLVIPRFDKLIKKNMGHKIEELVSVKVVAF